jgi:hypothetical protein
MLTSELSPNVALPMLSKFHSDADLITKESWTAGSGRPSSSESGREVSTFGRQSKYCNELSTYSDPVTRLRQRKGARDFGR